MKTKTIASIGTFALLVVGAPKADASLVNSYQFNGKGNWSIDGVGSNNTPVGDISAIVPVGSTIEKAFLYSTTLLNTSFVPNIDFDGTVYSGSDWIDLGSTTTCCNVKAFRTDVTTQVATKIGGGGGSPFIFSVQNEDPNASIDGEVLAIVYSNPSETERTIAFLDGFSDTTGDTTAINLANPLTSGQLTDPSFEALMSLGIGFGFQGTSQFSQVDVNGQRLTSSAGGQDDGADFNGGLVTVGGIGDDPANPIDPNATANGDPRFDDELYTLTPFLNAGDTQIKIDTLNPSNDDDIFFLGLNITAEAGVNQPPPNGKVPEPASALGLLAVGALGAVKRRKQSARKYSF